MGGLKLRFHAPALCKRRYEASKETFYTHWREPNVTKSVQARSFAGCLTSFIPTPVD
ncbi:hypothetical protein SAMN05518683_111111 [Salibacterium halotolerans]|uniref:Uncharacterized protein n=1 Tax=Salibacterium halotolerans TaxID=1884432 RepID=A0A1I5TVC6_9BACI|nr:hypothetical protein SAMN05518683_111111 [Salibacterium halotolerans]